MSELHGKSGFHTVLGGSFKINILFISDVYTDDRRNVLRRISARSAYFQSGLNGCISEVDVRLIQIFDIQDLSSREISRTFLLDIESNSQSPFDFPIYL